jgi:hypothetical protein
MYRCKQCRENEMFCRACRDTHRDRHRHQVYLDVRTEYILRGECVECEQPLSACWFQPKNEPEAHLFKMCESCVRANCDEAWGYLGRPEYDCMQTWSDLTPAVMLTAWKISCLPDTRYSRHDPRMRQRIYAAYFAFSMRRYFTRLWVCPSPRLRIRDLLTSGR